MYFKDFDKWNELKKQIDNKDGKVYIRAGEKRVLSRRGRISQAKLKAVNDEILKFYNF